MINTMGKPLNKSEGSASPLANGPKGVRLIEGDLSVNKLDIAVVAARFNEKITDRLLASALAEADRLGVAGENLAVARVPGSLELATAAKAFIDADKYDAVVCLGCVIRGETDHYDAVVQGAQQGITQLTVQTGLPVIFGVLTCDNEKQAMDRSEAGGERDTGTYAMRAAVEMANLRRGITG